MQAAVARGDMLAAVEAEVGELASSR